MVEAIYGNAKFNPQSLRLCDQVNPYLCEVENYYIRILSTQLK